MLAVLESATGDQDGEIVVGVRIRIAHAGSVNDGGLIEQVLRVLQIVEQARQLAELRTLDEPKLFQFIGLIAVMGQRVRSGIDALDVRLGDVLMNVNRDQSSRIRFHGELCQIKHRAGSFDQAHRDL